METNVEDVHVHRGLASLTLQSELVHLLFLGPLIRAPSNLAVMMVMRSDMSWEDYKNLFEKTNTMLRIQTCS